MTVMSSRGGRDSVLRSLQALGYDHRAFLSRLDRIFEERGIAPNQRAAFVCVVTGMTPQAYSNWKTRDLPPSLPALLAICLALECDVVWLLTGRGGYRPGIILSPAERAWLDLYRQAKPQLLKSLAAQIDAKSGTSVTESLPNRSSPGPS